MAGAHLLRMHRHAIGIGQGNHIGEVIFALGIIALQGAQPIGQVGVGQHKYAGIGFGDGFLGGIGVFFFHNRHHSAVFADDAPVACGLGQYIGEQPHFVARGIKQRLQGLAVGERHIAVEHQSAPVRA